MVEECCLQDSTYNCAQCLSAIVLRTVYHSIQQQVKNLAHSDIQPVSEVSCYGLTYTSSAENAFLKQKQ